MKKEDIKKKKKVYLSILLNTYYVTEFLCETQFPPAGLEEKKGGKFNNAISFKQ